MFQINTFGFVLLQSLVQNQKSLNLGPKMPGLGIFGLKFENTIIIFEIGTLKFVLAAAKFGAKLKILKVSSKD